MAEGNSRMDVWKWVAGSLGALMISNVITALSFRMDVSEIQAIARSTSEDAFTEMSRQRGMYAIEGRPRIAALETQVKVMQETFTLINERLARIETKLDALAGK